MKTLGVFLGMGGDQRALAPLLPDGWTIVEFPWPVPAKGESLSTYCQRPEAQSLLSCDALLGFSFGALPVLELQKRKTELPVLLISCGINSSEVSGLLRLPIYRSIISILPSQQVHRLVYSVLGISKKYGKPFQRMLDKVDPITYKWALGQSLTANFSLLGNYHRLHGAEDKLFPASKIPSAEVVENAGHLLLRDQPKSVRNWLGKSLTSLP